MVYMPDDYCPGGFSRRRFLRTAAAASVGTAALGSGSAAAGHEDQTSHPGIEIEDAILDWGEDNVPDYTVHQETSIDARGYYTPGADPDEETVQFRFDIFTGIASQAYEDSAATSPGEQTDDVWAHSLDVSTNDPDVSINPATSSDRIGTFPAEDSTDGEIDVTGAGWDVVQQAAGELRSKVGWGLTAYDVARKLSPVQTGEPEGDATAGFSVTENYAPKGLRGGEPKAGHYAQFFVDYPRDLSPTLTITTGSNEDGWYQNSNAATELEYTFQLDGPFICSWDVEKTRSEYETWNGQPPYDDNDDIYGPSPGELDFSTSGGPCYRSRRVPLWRSNDVHVTDLHLPDEQNGYLEVESSG